MSKKIEIRVVYSKKDKEYYENIKFDTISEFSDVFLEKIHIFQDSDGSIPKENVEKIKKMLQDVKKTGNKEI